MEIKECVCIKFIDSSLFQSFPFLKITQATNTSGLQVVHLQVSGKQVGHCGRMVAQT
jgi:hypothetical protein